MLCVCSNAEKNVNNITNILHPYLGQRNQHEKNLKATEKKLKQQMKNLITKP